MAVELRCPDCRAKLRLKVAPEAGTEVECPKCGTVFPAPESKPEAEGDEDAPKKKKTEDGEEKAQKDADKSEKKDKKTKKGAAPNTPKKRKAKKRETSKAALIGVISAGVLMLCCMTGVLIWFFTRTSKAVEMFYYAPDDAQYAMGMNLGHAQKYPEFYKQLKTLLDGAEFKPAGDAIGKAGGSDMDTLMDYVVIARSAKNGAAIVFRTKTEFDSSDLSKIPGAEKKSVDGKTYYVAPNLLPNNESGRVFAPTNRLVVVCSANSARLNDATFKKMINGNADTREKTLGMRMGNLGKRITRGTFWRMTVLDTDVKMDSELPEAGEKTSGDDSKAKKRQAFSDSTSGSVGYGIKASLGSREVRVEIVVGCQDSEKSSSVTKKWKESDLGKGDEGTPPKWFKDDTSAIGGTKVAAQLLSNISFGSSAELFYVKSSVETIDVQPSASTAIGIVLGIAPKNQMGSPGGGPGAMPGGPGGAPPPGGGPGGAPPVPGGPGAPPGPGGPGVPTPPKMRRRSGRVRACR